MRLTKTLRLLFLFTIIAYQAQSQCNTLRPQIDISFNTDQDCAPVEVTQFQITYYFNVAQDPATISILYEWNDPLNSNTLVDLGSGLVPSAGNTAFTANATFLYTDNNGQCNIIPTASIFINGVICPTSSQTQTAFFWGTDQQANGIVAMTPPNWDVCYGNPVVNAIFQDDSEFNCNIAVEPDNPNRLARHVQFVYGTNHNAAATIRNLTLNDGAVQGLTDGTGNLVSTITRGTGTTVTGAYFGPVETIPFPADGPTAATFPMNAPANAANLVGNRFEVTLYNWNVCNPWNGDPVNPNYGDAVLTRGYIVIVDAPDPAFITLDNANVPTTSFCINETIFFRNQTPNAGAFNYTWEFYDDATGTTLLSTSTQRNPTFAYPTGGTKLIRLRAENPTAQGSCIEEVTALVNITPALVANILVTDLADIPITPDFCQEATAPFTNFNARFTDASTGAITANTGWRWEFFDQNNNRILEAPVGGGYSSTALGPFDRVFTTKGIYRVRLSIRDNVTLCESSDEVQVRVFEKPVPVFTANRVCVGTATAFVEASTVNPIMGERIVLREWDMNYSGTFTKDPTLDNQTAFNYTFATAGTHRVALRITTDQGGCATILDKDVFVDPMPVASFTADQAAGCSVLTVNFTNTSVAGQPDIIKEYIWEIDDGSGFVVDSIQRPTDPGFSAIYSRSFTNNLTTNIAYTVRLRVITTHDCETISAPRTITVYPGPRSGFIPLNYSPFNNNCSPVSVNFAVDGETQSLNPSDYIWTISDAAGQIDQISTGTTPTFSYIFNNTSTTIRDFTVDLRAVLPSGCYGDSSRVIRVNPIPPSDFTIDTVVYDCEKVILNLDATQKGLLEYAWSISINGSVMYTSTTDGDNFDYQVLRSSTVDQTVAVTLKTTNLTNCESAATIHSVVVPKTNAINASFTATPMTQTLPASTVTITNNTTPGPWDYRWDFGDGTTSTSANPGSHTYATYGTYTISLTVRDNDCEESQVVTVQINPIPPVLDFDYFPPAGCSPLTVNFVNKSQYADPASYHWEFGVNQGTSRAINPSYTYYEPGIYSVTLSATNALGDTVSITKSMIIEVYESPTAQFSVYPHVLSIPGDLLYTNNKSFNATSFLWNFGDSTTSTEFEPQHAYKEEGTYDITLIAYNSSGCSDTVTVASAVLTNKSGQLKIPNAFTPNLSGPGSTNAMANEIFIPLMRGVTKFQMLVFNRWGELLFESTNPDSGWDGYYKGVLCQQDVYIYKITVEYDDGKKFTRTGDVSLIR
ncbi:MAG TPA: PKD domain-containing protein [Ohtaekwangia sp.]|uniref:PKD domain-containing protein n=1 Tax=Ohtaekwangia sp. TaxID=2066019 RepID=UPI002F95AB58